MFKKVVFKPSTAAGGTPNRTNQASAQRVIANKQTASQPQKNQMPDGQASQNWAAENQAAENNVPESRLRENKPAAVESLLERYPAVYLTIMLALMLGSAGHLLRRTSVFSASQHAPISYSGPLSASFEGIVTSSSALGELIHIKTQIDNILAKDSLSQRDSIVIEHALSRFGQIQHELGGTTAAGAHAKASDKHTTP